MQEKEADALDVWSETAVLGESVVLSFAFTPINIIVRRVLRGALAGTLIGTSILLVLYGLIHFSVI